MGLKMSYGYVLVQRCQWIILVHIVVIHLMFMI